MFPATFAEAQSVKDIVSRYEKALRKTVHYDLIKTIYLKGTFTVNGSLTFPGEAFYKTPKNMRMQMQYQNLTFLQIYNDSVKWEYNSAEKKSTITRLTKSESNDWTKQSSSFDFVRYDLLNYKEKNIKVTLDGTQNFDSLQVYVLKLGSNGKTTIYINSKDFLITKISDEKGQRHFGKYKVFDDFIFPTYISETSSDQDMKARFDGVKFNTALADSLFIIPKSAFEEDVSSKKKDDAAFKEADSLYTEGHYKAAIDRYTSIISKKPQNFRAYNSRGLAKIQMAEYYDAISDFTKALEIDPASANARNNLGLAKFYLGDYAGAIKDYNLAIELNQKMVIAIKNRGLAYIRQEKYEEAKIDFTNALKYNPEDGEAHFKLGISQAQLENYIDALKSYTEALKYNYQTAEVFNYKGVTEYRLEKFDSASISFEKAVSLDNKNLQYLENYGRALYESGHYAAASAEFEKYIQSKNDNPEMHNLLGLCKYQDENYKGAIQDFSTAIKLNGSEAAYYDNRASAKDLLEDYEGAIKDYSESIRIYPNDGSVFYKRGLLKLKTSKKLEGCSDLGTSHDMKYEPAKEAIMKHCN